MKYRTKFYNGFTYLVESTTKTCESVYRDGWFDVGCAKDKATSVRCKPLYLRTFLRWVDN